MSDDMTPSISNPDCLDGGPNWCCVDLDGTGLWCDSCTEFATYTRPQHDPSFFVGKVRRAGQQIGSSGDDQ